MDEIKEHHPYRGDWLREIVFGLNDGLVTTLVFIMAVSEVAPARLLLVVLGEVLAGGVSMALGGYLAARTAKQILDQRIAIERYEIEHEPEEERAELVAIHYTKGFTVPFLQRVVSHLRTDQDRWHRAMVHDELGVVEDMHIHPWLQGMQIGLSFVVGGLIPTIPVLLSSFANEMVGVWAHGSHGRGAGSGQSPLYPSASCVGWSGISRRRHAFEPRLVWVLAYSYMEDEPAVGVSA